MRRRVAERFERDQLAGVVEGQHVGALGRLAPELAGGENDSTRSRWTVAISGALAAEQVELDHLPVLDEGHRGCDLVAAPDPLE